MSETIVGHPDFSQILDWTAEPEAVVRFDSFRGEPANLDVLVRGEDANGPVLIEVEAKADETFGGTVKETATKAKARLDSNPRSKGMLRIERLVRGLFGLGPEEIASVLHLRYQLLTATAAALAESARTGSSRAVVFTHEFVTPLTTDDRHETNGADLDRFVSTLVGTPTGLGDREMIGPVNVPGEPIVDDPARLYFGKARVVRR